MTDTELDELERLAQAATPGPWRADADEMVYAVRDGRLEGAVCECIQLERMPADARYIAAASPLVILGLIGELRVARGALSTAVHWAEREVPDMIAEAAGDDADIGEGWLGEPTWLERARVVLGGGE